MYVHPYSIWWSCTDQFGFAVNATKPAQYTYGPDANASTAQYFFAPVGIKSLVVGATEFTDGSSTMKLFAQNFKDFSVQAYLYNSTGQVWFPIVQGMGFLTAVYSNLTPQISSAVGFTSIEEVQAPQSTMRKYALYLNNGVRWYLYISLESGTIPSFSLSADKSKVIASSSVNGAVVQVTEATVGYGNYYDKCAGRYQTDAYLTGSVSGNQAHYKIQYVAEGKSTIGMPLVYAAPHHRQMLYNMGGVKVTPLEMYSPTLGLMKGYVSTVLEFLDTIPTTIGFLPYNQLTSPVKYTESELEVECGVDVKQQEDDEFYMLRKCSAMSSPYVSDAVATKLTTIATAELQEDIIAQTNLDSMYFSGKGLDKFANVLMTVMYIVNNRTLAAQGLALLKTAFARFANNAQINPLVYDTTWKGLVSNAGLTNPDADFGNTYYNDHHFHYGYFIHAAAVIGLVDRDLGINTWVAQNKDFVNNLVRDVANPSCTDPYYPRWRSFDWFVGHSWAKGLFLSSDGKDEESSSEDVHFAYGMKLWGRVVGDDAMQARGNIMLSVLRRSLNCYMLYANNNTVMPAKIVGNKVSGILFENKVDYTTYFGTNVEYKHGIHMIPVTSVSSYIRKPGFCQEEWDNKLATLAPTLTSGWKGILYQNKALYDNATAYGVFNDDSTFSAAYLDGGMSRTWALGYCAYVGKY